MIDCYLKYLDLFWVAFFVTQFFLGGFEKFQGKKWIKDLFTRAPNKFQNIKHFGRLS